MIFNITGLNALYIDSIDRNEMTDELYLKNEDKICGIVTFDENGKMLLDTNDSEVRAEFLVLCDLTDIKQNEGCLELYEVAEKLDNAIDELNAIMTKIDLLQRCEFTLEGSTTDPDLSCKVNNEEWYTLQSDGSILVNGYEDEKPKNERTFEAFKLLVAEYYKNIEVGHFAACMIALQDFRLPVYFVDVD